MQRPLSVGAAGGVSSSLLFANGHALLERSPSNLESRLPPLAPPVAEGQVDQLHLPSLVLGLLLGFAAGQC